MQAGWALPLPGTTINLDSATVDLSSIFGTGGAGDDLVSNATHYLRVRAVGFASHRSALTAVVSTLTIPAAPGGPVLSDVRIGSVTYSWTNTTNAPQTLSHCCEAA